jgi:hypothetical protein
MPSPHIIPLLPVFRPLVVASTISLLLLFTARTGSSANQRTRSNSQTLAASSSNLSFGNIQLGNSLTQFETITNTGDATVTISQATVTGPGFGVRGLTLPTSLSKGESVTFRVLCTPLDSGNMFGTIAVVSNVSNQLNIALSGNGVSAGQLTASASALDFGGVAVGSSKSIPATLTATGSSVTISSATSTSGEFSLSGISIPQTIPAGKTVSLTITFKPQTTGAASGTISFGGNNSSTLAVESLIGSGTASSSSHAVSLRWIPSTSDVVGYNIYRGSVPGGPYTKINPVLTPSTSYVDSSVQGGKTYYYVSTAIEPGGTESKYSNQMQAVIPSP